MAMKKGSRHSKATRARMVEAARKREADKRRARVIETDAAIKRSTSMPLLKHGVSPQQLLEQDHANLASQSREMFDIAGTMTGRLSARPYNPLEPAVFNNYAGRHAALTQDYLRDLRTLLNETSLQLIGKTIEEIR